MAFRSHTHKQPETAARSATVQHSWRSRPFAPPAHLDLAQTQQPPDLQTQLERSRRLGHHLENFICSAEQPAPSLIHPKRTLPAPAIQTEQDTVHPPQPLITQHLGATFPLIQRAVAPDLSVGTEVEILHKKAWEVGIIKKVKLEKKHTIYSVRRKNGGKKDREFKHTSDQIRPLQTNSPPLLEKTVTSIPPLREPEPFTSTIPNPAKEKSAKKQPPPLRTPPESPRQSLSFEGFGQPGLRKTPPPEEWSHFSLLQQPFFIPPETSKPPLKEQKIPGLRDDPEEFFETTVAEKSEQKHPKIPAFNRTMRRTPPRKEWESFSFAPSQKMLEESSDDEEPLFSARKTPPSSLRPLHLGGEKFTKNNPPPLRTPPESPRQSFERFMPEKGFFQVPKIPGLRDEPEESFETSISLPEEDYVNAVATRFSEETGKIFRKLWHTALPKEKQQIKTLFSADARLKNLNSLEYLLEGLDPLHRLEHIGGLEAPAGDWLKDATDLYFFDWLLEPAQQKKYEYLKFAGQVDYFDAEKRQNYLLQMGSTVTFVNSKQPLQGEVIYVLSQSDQFYASAGGVSDTGNLIHHSSFLSGQAVKCAGHMEFNSGKLQTINVTSGHYKPNQPQMISALQVLQKQGVPLETVSAQPSPDKDYSPALALLN